MKRMIMTIALLTLSSSTLWADFICWDGTFGYNAAGFFKKENRFELTFRGAQIGPLSFRFLGNNVTIDAQNYYGNMVHVAFNLNECSFDKASEEWSCERNASGLIGRNVFVETSVDDLEQGIPVISATHSDLIQARIKKGGDLTISFSEQSWDGRTISRQESKVRLDHCDGLAWGGMDGTRFPGRLSKYLDERK